MRGILNKCEFLLLCWSWSALLVAEIDGLVAALIAEGLGAEHQVLVYPLPMIFVQIDVVPSILHVQHMPVEAQTLDVIATNKKTRASSIHPHAKKNGWFVSALMSFLTAPPNTLPMHNPQKLTRETLSLPLLGQRPYI